MIGLLTDIPQSDIYFASFKIVCDKANCSAFFERLFDPSTPIDNVFAQLCSDLESLVDRKLVV